MCKMLREVIGGILWEIINHRLQLQMKYWHMYRPFLKKLDALQLPVIWNQNHI